MTEFEQARIIALTLLSNSELPDEQQVRQAAEIAIRTLPPGSQVDIHEGNNILK